MLKEKAIKNKLLKEKPLKKKLLNKVISDDVLVNKTLKNRAPAKLRTQKGDKKEVSKMRTDKDGAHVKTCSKRFKAT